MYSNYIGETKRNVEVRIDEHSNPCNDSEPARHLRENPSHSFSWRILCTAQYFYKRRIIEGLMIQQCSPSLNKQIHSNMHTDGLFYPDDDFVLSKTFGFLTFYQNFFMKVNNYMKINIFELRKKE